MSTRSTIGKLLPNGKIRYIYCHWDGYIEHNGKMLFSHYNNEELVDQLLALGDASYLDTTLAKCQFYGRDRNETDVAAVEDTMSNFDQQAYAYLWKDNKWYVRKIGNDVFEPLEAYMTGMPTA